MCHTATRKHLNQNITIFLFKKKYKFQPIISLWDLAKTVDALIEHKKISLERQIFNVYNLIGKT